LGMQNFSFFGFRNSNFRWCTSVETGRGTTCRQHLPFFLTASKGSRTFPS
jgi:hypothetical protein